MYAIMTVTGADSTGIIAAVTTTLAELDINVIDVSQTLMGGYFTMILRVEFDADKVSIQTIKERMRPVACLLYTSPSPRDLSTSRMPSSA